MALIRRDASGSWREGQRIAIRAAAPTCSSASPSAADAFLVKITALSSQFSVPHLRKLIIEIASPIAKDYSLQKFGGGNTGRSSRRYEFTLALYVSVAIFTTSGWIGILVVGDVVYLVLLNEFWCENPRCIWYDFIHPAAVPDSLASFRMVHDALGFVLSNLLIGIDANKEVY